MQPKYATSMPINASVFCPCTYWSIDVKIEEKIVGVISLVVNTKHTVNWNVEGR